MNHLTTRVKGSENHITTGVKGSENQLTRVKGSGPHINQGQGQ